MSDDATAAAWLLYKTLVQFRAHFLLLAELARNTVAWEMRTAFVPDLGAETVIRYPIRDAAAVAAFHKAEQNRPGYERRAFAECLVAADRLAAVDRLRHSPWDNADWLKSRLAALEADSRGWRPRPAYLAHRSQASGLILFDDRVRRGDDDLGLRRLLSQSAAIIASVSSLLEAERRRAVLLDTKEGSQPALPAWDAACGRLSFRGRVRAIAGRAKNVRKLLAAFQLHQWQDRIPSPFQRHPRLRPQVRQAVESANHVIPFMRFEMDGTGDGVRWSPRG